MSFRPGFLQAGITAAIIVSDPPHDFDVVFLQEYGEILKARERMRLRQKACKPQREICEKSPWHFSSEKSILKHKNV
jgi:hypothetical protein